MASEAALDKNLLLRAAGYAGRRKVADYLHECWYDRLDYDTAFEYMQTTGYFPSGACSAVRKGNFIGRNFDWFYNEDAEFVIHVPAIANRYASIGIGGGLSITDSEVGKPDIRYAFLPFMMMDGINEKGVFAEMNVVPASGTNDVIEPMENTEIQISSVGMVRYIIDNFSTAAEAIDYICRHVSVFFPKKLKEMNYEVHYMVCDENESYVLEFVGGRAMAMGPKVPAITNFVLDGVIFNSDGSVYTPEIQNGSDNAISANKIAPFGSGLERWNIISEVYPDVSDEKGMRYLMDALKYSHAYPSKKEADPFWYSEFVGDKLTCASKPEDFAMILDTAGKMYATRTRENGKTWHTCHSTIYDIANRSFKVIPQESGKEYEFKL